MRGAAARMQKRDNKAIARARLQSRTLGWNYSHSVRRCSFRSSVAPRVLLGTAGAIFDGKNLSATRRAERAPVLTRCAAAAAAAAAAAVAGGDDDVMCACERVVTCV